MSSNREQRLIEIELDSINSLSDVSEYLTKYKHKHEILCGKTKYIIEDDKVIIYDIETENEEQKLKLKYNFFINADLHYKLWLFDNPVSPIRFKHITENTKISCFTEVLHLLEFLQNLPAEPLLPDEALYFVDKLKNIETPNNLVNSKLLFLIEQLHLTFMHNKHRRYSADLLSTCVLWENTSTNLYKQIREEGHLTIPSLRYIKKLTSAVSVDTGLTTTGKKYLEARFAKLQEREKIGSLIIDEVYVAKRCEFTRSNGRIYGMENTEQTKTLLTVMFSSIAGEYEDVIAIVPLHKINSTIIANLFKNVLKCLDEIGYQIVVCLVDGHSSNVKLYQTELCEGQLKAFVYYPHDEGKIFFIIFDPTHIFKCIYNNLQVRKVFTCPLFDGIPVSASFNDIKELYELEFTRPVKMAYMLNDQCINPQPIEKSKVRLAASVFSESTRNAMSYYVKNGYPQWEGTLNFLNLISKWWEYLNVKTTSKGVRKRDNNLDCLRKENLNEFTLFFSKFVTWVENWKTSGGNGLSAETFRTLIQTSKTLPQLVHYLLHEKGLAYVLSGKIQSDPLEKRFGRYRQLSGANYFGTERQFLEAEKAIRVKSLIEFSRYSMKEVCHIMEENGDTSSVDEHSEHLVDILSEDITVDMFNAEHLVDILSEDITVDMFNAEANIIYYVAGFIARALKKISKCQKCIDIFGCDEETTGLDIHGLDEDCTLFVNSINRGGLVKPSDIIYSPALHHGTSIRK